MFDEVLLKQKIKDSGLKINFVAEKVGISYQAFWQKMEGKSKFTLEEIQKLCDVLNLSTEDRDLIFFTQNVDETSTNAGGE